MKRCSACDGEGPFGKNASTKDGRQSRCKACHSRAVVESKRRHRASVNAYERARVAKNRETVNAQKLAWYRRNRESEIEKVRAKRAANPEHKRALDAKWREAHREEQRARGRAWIKRWAKEHPEENRANARKRRARMAGVANTLTPDEWQAILVRFGHRCAYCGQGDVLMTQDHVVPISKGGAHSVENVVPACKACNSRKKDRPLRPGFAA